MKVNKKLLPVKAHFFFFMAASGPILPFLTVYGKQLGISEVVMGSVTAVVPLVFLLAKPFFGFLADYFYNSRKLIFMSLIVSMSLFYVCLYFIPPVNIRLEYSRANNNFSELTFCNHSSSSMYSEVFNASLPSITCNVTCTSQVSDSKCQLLGYNVSGSFCYEKAGSMDCQKSEIPSACKDECLLQSSEGHHIYRSFEFYGFIFLMTLSMIAYNVSNSISDAICFDILGDGGEKKYGYQRVWGTVGFGLTAFLGGVGMDYFSGGEMKNYTPAFIMVVVFTIVDMVFCRKLKLPKMTMPKNIFKELGHVFQNKAIGIFLIFATLIGALDGFIIFFLFWYLEDLSIATSQMKYIKLLEGLTVAAETLGGEIIFFVLSGKILKKLGYGHTLSFCLFNYGVRMGLISLISNPWWVLAIELIMQGPTYALCYTTVVAYASAISPPGTSATMQGIVAGVDDGFGYSLGSLIGGFLYKAVGGKLAFQIFSSLAFFCCFAHIILYKLLLKKSYNKANKEILNNYKSHQDAAVKMTELQSLK